MIIRFIMDSVWRGCMADPVHRTLQVIVDRVTRRLRAAGRTGSTVVLRLRFDDFTRSTTSRTLPQPTDNTGVVLDTARRLLAQRLPEIHDRGCTLLGITLSGLDTHEAQLMLPLASTDDGSVDAAIDAVRDKFGAGAIGAASLRRTGHSAPPVRGLAQVL